MNSIKWIEIVVSAILVLLGIVTITSRKTMTAIVYLSLVSMFAVLSFAIMQAPDVAITEAVIGSGLVTAVFLFTLLSVRKAGEKE